MKLFKKITVLSFVLIALSTTSYAKNTLESTRSEEGYIFYGQKVKIKIVDINPSHKIIEESISGVPFGLQFNIATGYLEGTVDIEEGKIYPYENTFTYDIENEDGTISNLFLNIFTVIPSADRFQLIKNLKGKQTTVSLKDQDTINYVTDGRDIAIRASGFFEFGNNFFASDNYLVEDLTMDLYINNSFFKREYVVPYALNGDIDGVYNTLGLKEGTYTIGTKLYSQSLNKYVSEMEKITIVIVDPIDEVPVINGVKGSFPRFVGTAVDVEIDAQDPNRLPLTYTGINLPPTLSLDSKTGRITGVLDLNSYESNVAFDPFFIEVSNGTYSESIKIRIPELQTPIINSITLINAATDKSIAGYEYLPVDSTGTVEVALELTNELNSINVVANTNIGMLMGGVVDFAIDDTFFRRERIAPYAIAGNLSEDYLSWEYNQDDIADLGFQRINGTATIKKSKSLVNVGLPVNFSFLFTHNFSDVKADDIINSLTITPNPATNFVELNNITSDCELGFLYQISSATTGTIVKEDFVNYMSNRIDISDFPKGMYSIKVATESDSPDTSFYTKFIKQ